MPRTASPSCMQAAATSRGSCRAGSRRQGGEPKWLDQIHRNGARDELARSKTQKEQSKTRSRQGIRRVYLCFVGEGDDEDTEGREVGWRGQEREDLLQCTRGSCPSEGCLFIERTEGAKGLELLKLLGRKSDEMPRLTGFFSLSERQKPWTIPARCQKFFFTTCDFSRDPIPLLPSSAQFSS